MQIPECDSWKYRFTNTILFMVIVHLESSKLVTRKADRQTRIQAKWYRRLEILIFVLHATKKHNGFFSSMMES